MSRSPTFPQLATDVASLPTVWDSSAPDLAGAPWPAEVRDAFRGQRQEGLGPGHRPDNWIESVACTMPGSVSFIYWII